MRIALAQINPIVGDCDGNAKLILEQWARADSDKADLILYPELALTGYFPEDLLEAPDFIAAVEKTIKNLIEHSKQYTTAAIIGAPYKDHVRGALFNSFYFIQQGELKTIQHKYNLPNYGVFDEKRYFTKPHLPEPILFQDHKIGFMICEDFWELDVSHHLVSQGAQIFMVINASPYCTNKINKRIAQAHLQQKNVSALPLIYLNLIGGQDDLIFDGSSFIMNEQGEIIHQMRSFETDFTTIDYKNKKLSGTNFIPHKPINESEEIYRACVLGLRDYLQKTHTKQVLLGLSGGIDSALVAAMAVDAIGADNVLTVMLPSPFTSQSSLDDAADCAKRLGIDYKIIPINSIMTEFETLLAPLTGTPHENMQARIRGALLMTLSNQTGRMLLTTGNKSEMATGYATLYGDMCGGYNPIKDLYKTKVFELAEWRNTHHHYSFKGAAGIVIPDTIITKPPSAELRSNQKDQDTLPPYETLDAILTGLLEENKTAAQLIEQGFDAETILKIEKRLFLSEYKRKQSAPGPKISLKAFTRERRFPIVNSYQSKI